MQILLCLFRQGEGETELESDNNAGDLFTCAPVWEAGPRHVQVSPLWTRLEPR